MSKRNRHRIQLVKAVKLRWPMESISIQGYDSDSDSIIDSDEMIVNDSTDSFNWTNKILMNRTGDLFLACINQCNLKNIKYIIIHDFKTF